MTDDFRSPYEIEDDENSEKTSENDTQENNENQVDSLVDNDVGTITMGNGKKGKSAVKNSDFWSRGLQLWPTTKQHKIIGSSLAAAILIMGMGGVFALNNSFRYQPDLQPAQQIIKPEPKTHEPSKLTGLRVPVERNQRPVTAVMIENSPDARPQAGLHEAGVVFEAIAEGGITRFCALYQESDQNYIGPVRSVRPYYVDWAAGFAASVAHAGGSGGGLERLSKLKVRDLDYTKADAYQRVSDRFAPHNLYTSMKRLLKVSKDKGFKARNFQSFKRKVEQPLAGQPVAANIDFSISGGLYDTGYGYDQKNNRYNRFLAGSPHKDHRSSKRITPKVVIALITKYSQNGIYSVYRTTGKGQIIVFQDGQATRGTWKKAGPKEPLEFFDVEGKPLALNPGQTWITALGSASSVKYRK